MDLNLYLVCSFADSQSRHTPLSILKKGGFVKPQIIFKPHTSVLISASLTLSRWSLSYKITEEAIFTKRFLPTIGFSLFTYLCFHIRGRKCWKYTLTENDHLCDWSPEKYCRYYDLATSALHTNPCSPYNAYQLRTKKNLKTDQEQFIGANAPTARPLKWVRPTET